MDDLVSYRIENAREKLESSKILLDAGHYKDSIGRLFYFYRSSCGFRSAGFCAVPIPGTTIRHTIGSVGDIDGLWLLQIGEPVGVGFLRAVVEPYVVTSGEGTPSKEGRSE